MGTIKDVAKAAGVSAATVSAVVNGSAYVSPALRARVLEAIDKQGYAPSQLARNLRRGRSGLIAIAVADLSNMFFSRVICAAEAAVVGLGLFVGCVQQRRKSRSRKADSLPRSDDCAARASFSCPSAEH